GLQPGARGGNPLDAAPPDRAGRRPGDRRAGLPRDDPSAAKKNALKPWQKQSWCLPDGISGEFLWKMEDVLNLYAQPYDPKRPVVCFDEARKELHGQARQPLPPAPGRPAREDYEYSREGTANLFLFVEPLAGRRHVAVTDHRAGADFAQQMKHLC